MANVMFKKGLLANLPATYAEGTFYVITDERAIYLDVSDSARIRLGDFQEFATLEALKANTNPSTTALYYVDDINCLAKWNGTEYIQINRDTGMTSVEVTGEGNAVTAASYDAVTRKLTLTLGETFATAAELSAADEAIRDYVNEKTNGIATDAALGELQDKVTAAEEAIEALEADTHTHANAEVLNGITAEKVADWDDAVIKEHEHSNKDVLDGITAEDVAAWDAKQDAGDYATKAEAQGYADAKDEAIAAAKKSGDDAMAEAQKKVASVAAGDGSVIIGGTATAPTVAAKISQDADNALALAEDGLKVVIPAAVEYSIVKAADSGDYAAVYNLTKGGEIVGASINIPKDMVVKSGSVVDGDIVLVLNDEANTEIVIPADSLIEYVTSGSQTGDMVVIAVSDDHKVTASITDGSITLAKLATDVQTAIGKAHSHENADVLAGITAQNIVDWNDAVAKEHEHANKDVIDGITAEKVAAWDGAQAAAEATAAAALGEAKTELEGKISAAQTAAEKVATDLNDAMNTRVEALEGIDHDAYVAADETNLQAAKDYADGLAGNYDEAGAAAAVQGDTDKTVKDIVDQMTWGSF